MIAEKNKSTDLTILSKTRIADMKCNLIDDFPLHYSTNLSNNRCADNGIIFNTNFDLVLINSIIYDNVSAVNYHIKKISNENFSLLSDAFNQMNRDLYDLNNHINTNTVPSISELIKHFNALEQTVIDNKTSLEKAINDNKLSLEKAINDNKLSLEKDLDNLKTEFQKETGNLKTEFQKETGNLKTEFQKDNKSLKDDFHDYKLEQKDKKILSLKNCYILQYIF